MRILFVITGIGLGHTMRETAIINELKKRNKNIKIKIAGFQNSYTYFKDKYNTIKIKGSRFPQSSFTVNSIKVVIANLPYILYFLYDYLRLRKEIKKFKPNLIIVDAQPIGSYTGKKLGIKTISIYNLDLKAWDHYQEYTKMPFTLYMQSRFHFKFVADAYNNSDLVIIPTIKKKKSTKEVNFVDPILRTSPESLPSEKALMKKLHLKKRPILVMLGGSKFGFSVAEKIVRIARDFNEDFIIFGYKEFRKSNVTSFKFKENFLEYLKTCKAVILLSGHTALSEAIVYKKPSLVFPFKNYVEHYINVSELGNLSLVRYISENIQEKELKKYIIELIKKSPELEKNLKKVKIGTKGTKEAVDIILRQIS